MDILQKITDFLSQVPEWVFLFVVPALIAASAVAFVFIKQRRWFFVADALFGAAGFTLAYAKDASSAFLYLGILAAFSALLSLLFLIPVPRKRARKRSREEKIFEKFHEELSEKPYRPHASMPQKVCCFEQDEERGATAKEHGTSLSYADALLEKLRKKQLEAGDRLETEELLSRLDRYREKTLSEAERSSLNDCLASVLKLTAKYQL